MDVWTSVLRTSNVYLAELHIKALWYFKTEIDRLGGWYEGYSAGIPTVDIYTDKVPYGCWHRGWPSNIYANIGRYLVLSKNNADNYFKSHHAVKKIKKFKSFGDKYYCKYALALGYHSLIMRSPPKRLLNRFEVVLCNDKCSTVRFNNTCAPVHYNQLVANNTFVACHCDDRHQNLNCNNEEFFATGHNSYELDYKFYDENYIVDHFKKLYNKSMAYSPLSVYTNYDCIMGFQHMEFLTLKVENEFSRNEELYVVFATNMLDYSSLDIHERVVDEVNSVTYDEVLLLNLETENKEYFSASVNAITALNDSRYHHHHHHHHGYVYSEVFEEALNSHLYHKLTNWISPWDNAMNLARTSTILLYSNINDTRNAAMFVVNNVLVGIIMYSTAVMKGLHIISLQQLLRWIKSKAKCMRRLGGDVIIVMGDGDKFASRLILSESHQYVTAVLGVESSVFKDLDMNITTNLDYTHYRDRIILLPSTPANNLQTMIARMKINLQQSNFSISTTVINL